MLIDSFGNKVKVEKLENKRFIMYGASTRNEKAIKELRIERNVEFFVDSNEEKSGQVLGKYKICSLSTLKSHEDCIILSVLVSHYKEIIEELDKVGIKNCLFYYPEYFDISEVFHSNSEVIKNKRNYKYIHIFSNDKFVIPFYQMLEERFPIEEHLLVVAYRIIDDFSKALPFLMEKCKKNYNILILDDVHGITNHAPTDRTRFIPGELDCNRVFYSQRLKDICHNANKIILHSAFWGNETKKFVYYLTQLYSSQMVWGCFGGDAYFDKDSFEVKEIISKVGVCSVSAGTYKIVKQNYGIDGKIDSDAYYVYIPKTVSRERTIHDSVHILLGHSAFEYGNHKYGLEILKKFKEENIKIYCPLSYGSEEYRNTIINIGKEIYGDKFIPMLSYLAQEQYFEFLQTIDVAVFPLKRLAAESTFLLLKAAGVKIYADINVVGYMQDTLVTINNIENIQYESLEEFTAFPQKQLYDADKLNNDIVIEWKKFFENNYEDVGRKYNNDNI